MSEREASVIDNSAWVDCDYLGWNIDTTPGVIFSASVWSCIECLQIPKLQELLWQQGSVALRGLRSFPAGYRANVIRITL